MNGIVEKSCVARRNDFVDFVNCVLVVRWVLGHWFIIAGEASNDKPQ